MTTSINTPENRVRRKLVRKNGSMTLYHIKRDLFLQWMRASYDAINLKVFGGELPRIPIKVANTKKNGYDATFTVMEKVYVSFTDGREREMTGPLRPSIVIGLHNAYFDDYDKSLYPIELMAHEMIHLSCYLQGIHNCDSKTQYHNFAFLQEAEKHGMYCTQWTQEYGFLDVHMTDEKFEQVIDCIPNEVWKMVRDSVKTVNARPR